MTEVNYLKTFLTELKNDVYRQENLIEDLRERAKQDLEEAISYLDKVRKEGIYDEYSIEYKDLLELIQKRKIALENLNKEKYIKYIKRKEREDEAKKYFQIKHADEMKEKCLYSIMILQEAYWANFYKIFNKHEEKILLGLIGFFQKIHSWIDEEQNTIHIRIKNTFDVIIKNFLFLIARNEKIFDRNAKREIFVDPDDMIRTLSLEERYTLIKPFIDIDNYFSILKQKKKLNLVSSLFNKLSEEYKNKILVDHAIDLKVTPFSILSFVQKLPEKERDVLFQQIYNSLQ
ncbi:MAG: hypothetical protein ACFFAS_06945 [Promethearchaeota archaeon]